MENHKDYSATIKSCAIAFLCVCENLMEDDDLKAWARGEINPNDRMDANVILDQIMVNHGIDTFNEDGEMSDEIIELFNACFDEANKLIAKKHTIEVIDHPYFLSDLHFSINDIFAQFDGGKIEQKDAETLARKCCAKFLMEE